MMTTKTGRDKKLVPTSIVENTRLHNLHAVGEVNFAYSIVLSNIEQRHPIQFTANL
jgi:hypothetical protein